MRRVVVTGLGLTTPLGVSVGETWDNLVAGRSGIRSISRFDVSDLPCRVAGQLPRPDLGEAPENGPDFVTPFVAEDTIARKDLRKIDNFIVYAIAAAEQAIADAGWKSRNRRRTRPRRRPDRLGHRRARDDLRRIDRAARAGAAPHLALLHPVSADQRGLGPRLDQIRLQGAEPFRCHGLLDRRPRDRRRCAPDYARRRRNHGCRRRRGRRCAAWAWPVSAPPGPCRRTSTTSPCAPRGRGTGTATVS